MHSPSASHRAVDIDAIELEKENIQPIRQGRSAQALTRLFAIQPEERAQELARQRQEFEDELQRIDQAADPMDVYTRYVSWTTRNYPQGSGQSHHSGLLPLLEQAIKYFQNTTEYSNDPRFVRILTLYSDMVDLPEDVFSFMEAKNIGVEVAMYYEAYADYLESKEDFEKASQIFSLGIHRRARPQGLLKKRFDEFQYRVQIHQDRLDREALESSLLPPQEIAQNPSRRVLGTKISRSESVHSNELSQGHAAIGSGALPLNGPSQSSGSSIQRRPNGRMQVYSDTSSSSSSSSSAIRTRPGQENPLWRDLGTQQLRRKENVRESTSWEGARLTVEDSFARRPHARLEVYRDPDTTAPEPPPTESAIQPTIPFRARSNSPLAGPSAPIQLNSLSITSTTEQPKAQLGSNPSSDNKERSPGASARRTSKLMFDYDRIYANDEDISPEELRAKLPRYAFRLEDAGIRGHESSKERPHHSSQVLPIGHGMESQHFSQQPPPTVRSLLPGITGDYGQPPFESRRRSTPSSPTLHTKYAFAEMNKIFSDRSRARTSLGSEWSSDGSLDGDQDHDDSNRRIFSLPVELPASSREYLENEIKNEYEDDDEGDTSGRTENFMKRLERGDASTITQDIEALKRKRAAEADLEGVGRSDQANSRLSFREGRRRLSRLDSNQTQDYSDITIAIRERSQQQHQQQQRYHLGGTESAGSQRSLSIERSRSSFGGSGSNSVNNSMNHASAVFTQAGHMTASTSRPRAFQVFRDDAENMELAIHVPMLEDEAPPAFLDHNDNELL
ncbi:hypothetical protein BGZ99_009426 [Dissophora globulifera]|uniref:BUB1 N-terminal domain-containing protein n=1 Tax=Dissophora globulifera TaxID=979702 RepID=A0A9P6RU91_9FUNG|nr:hypothetical protein BGZ99_009426 [Dissophora globulifera]